MKSEIMMFAYNYVIITKTNNLKNNLFFKIIFTDDIFSDVRGNKKNWRARRVRSFKFEITQVMVILIRNESMLRVERNT